MFFLYIWKEKDENFAKSTMVMTINMAWVGIHFAACFIWFVVMKGLRGCQKVKFLILSDYLFVMAMCCNPLNDSFLNFNLGLGLGGSSKFFTLTTRWL